MSVVAKRRSAWRCMSSASSVERAAVAAPAPPARSVAPSSRRRPPFARVARAAAASTSSAPMRRSVATSCPAPRRFARACDHVAKRSTQADTVYSYRPISTTVNAPRQPSLSSCSMRVSTQAAVPLAPVEQHTRDRVVSVAIDAGIHDHRVAHDPLDRELAAVDPGHHPIDNDAAPAVAPAHCPLLLRALVPPLLPRSLRWPPATSDRYRSRVSPAIFAQLKWSSTRLRPARPSRSRQARIERDPVDRVGEVGREAGRIHGVERPFPDREVDEQSGLAGDDHLRDAADCRGHDGRLAGHRLEVDDAERLVDGRAAEDRRVRVQLDGLRRGHHLLDPDHVGPIGAHLGHALGHLVADLPGVRGAGAQDHLQRLVDRGDRVHQVDDPLLARDAADEEHVRPVGIDAAADQGVDAGVRPVLLEVDPVVDHVDLLRRDVEVAQNVVAGLLRDRDDGVGVLDGGPLDPRREAVCVAELLDFPRSQRLERVSGQDERDAPQLLRQEASHVRVPRMAVDDVRVERVLRHRQTALEGVEGAPEPGIGVLFRGGPRPVPTDAQVGFVDDLAAEAADLDRDQAGELSAEVLDVDARPSVHVRRVLVCEQRDLVERRHDGSSPGSGERGSVAWASRGLARRGPSQSSSAGCPCRVPKCTTRPPRAHLSGARLARTMCS